MDTPSICHARFIPPMPPMARDEISGLDLLRAMQRNAYEAFPARCWQEPVLRLETPGHPVVIAASAESIRHFLLDNHQDYEKLPVAKRVWRPIVGDGLIISEGQEWRTQRRTMAPAFTPQKIQALSGLIGDLAERVCTEFEQSRGQAVDLFEFFQSVSFDIGATVMFSTDASRFRPELQRLLTFYATHLGTASVLECLLPPWAPTVSTVRRALFRRNWRRLIEHVIANRRAGHRTTTNGTASTENRRVDLFDLLEDAHGSQQNDLLIDQVSSMLVAGSETTALTLFWACVLLARYPDIQSELALEAATFDWKTSGSPRAEMDLTRLPLTKAVIMETLRLYPPAFLAGRLATRTHEVCGREIPAGSMVLLPFWVLHRNPGRWKFADSFDPWRFIDGPQPERFEYLPFGAGPHVCIGAQLAIAESTIMLARFVRDNTLEQRDDGMPLPVGRMSTRPSYSPMFVVTSRRA